MSVEGGGLFNQGFIGQGFNWWVGQVADDSYWRDNINPGKFEDKQSVPGWGYRYKVRIFGLHDFGEESIKSEDLPWSNVMYPVTAGAYLQSSGQTPMIRQGNIVFGFFLDGSEQQQPIIMGVIGNNSQTELATEIGTNRVSNTQPGTLGTSGYAEGSKTYEGQSAPISPDSDRVVNKPKDPELAKELAPSFSGKTNIFGLPSGKNITPQQQKDINSAKAEIELIKQNNPLFSQSQQLNLIKTRIAAGMSARKKEADSPRSKVHKGATIESESPHIQTSATIKLDEICDKKMVTLKPTSIVESCNKAMQIDMDNMTQDIDKAMNALASYTDAVSITKGVEDLKKVIKDSSKQQAKYMKVVMDKMKQYTEKKLNKEMTSAVSALPACKRWQFMDLKDNMTQNLMANFNQMSGGMDGLMEGILNDMLKVDGPDGIIEKAKQFAVNSIANGNEKPKAIPRVPVCSSEAVIARAIHAYKPQINKMNDNIISSMDGFIGDMMKEFADAGGGPITEMFSQLGDIRGNMTSALNFMDGAQDVFPFEVPPNEAVADFYTFCGGGGSTKQTMLPSSSAIDAAIGNIKPGDIVGDIKNTFAEPLKNTLNVDLLQDVAQQAEDVLDMFG